MNLNKNIIFISLILFFLLFSFSPTVFELSQSNMLADQNREFILEHNYYWPDFNLYLSKIRQGFEGRTTALERYTSEPHSGSLIQEFYVVLGLVGRFLNLDPNFSYQLGRLILSPLLLIVVVLIIKSYFKSYFWQILAFLIVVTSGSFPRFFTDAEGILHIGRYMEWWSNIDALQRLTFIPHILFGQVVSFYLLYRLTMNQKPKTKNLIFYIILGNTAGIVFPPSLITLIGVIFLINITKLCISIKHQLLSTKYQINSKYQAPNSKQVSNVLNFENWNLKPIWNLGFRIWDFLFIIFTLPSLLYLFFITKQLPWSALVEFHRAHPMMIPLDQYVLGTGPIIFLGFLGAVVSIIKKEKRFQPLILWVLVTFSLASLFSVIKEQSPLRFTQTGLFIPLGILGTYFFQQLWGLTTSNLAAGDASPAPEHSTVQSKRGEYDITRLPRKSEGLYGERQDPQIKILAKSIFIIILVLYLLSNLSMMKTSLDWQTTFIRQRIGANIPPVPYPPQTMYPLKNWMDAIRWLRDNTNHHDVVLADITAGNFIPAYSGNTVYFGQSNTVDYNRKQLEVDRFFKGEMKKDEARMFLQNGRIKFIFESIQEKEKLGGKNLDSVYPFLRSLYTNPITTIYFID